MSNLKGHANASLAMDPVCKVDQVGDLAKSLNSLRTVPGAPNPFVVSRQAARLPVERSHTSVPTQTEQASSQRR